MLPQYLTSTFFRFSLDDVILVSLKGGIDFEFRPKIHWYDEECYIAYVFCRENKAFFCIFAHINEVCHNWLITHVHVSST